MFKVKSVFYTVQGEGARSGTPAVFCRFAGCNLWSGREQDRASATCSFCDTDFLGFSLYDERALVDKIKSTWGGSMQQSDYAEGFRGVRPLCVFTGGEPGLQITETLISLVIKQGFSVAVETNGTVNLPDGTYWRTVSPKSGTRIKQVWGSELKVAWPQPGVDLEKLLTLDFKHFYLQPIDGVDGSTETTIAHVLRDPRWSLSLQTHKWVNLP